MSIKQSFTRILSLALTAGALSLAGLSAAQAADLTITHTAGETKVPAEPKKTVVFDLAALDTMHALGVDATAVPKARYVRQLEQYNADTFPKVGSLFEPDYEAINAIGPDLIIVGGRSRTKYADVSRLAPALDLSVDPKDLPGSVIRNTHILAKIYNKEAQAKTLLDKLNQSIDGLKAKAANAGTGLIILTTGGKMSAYGPGSRFGVIHDGFGMPAAAKDLSVSNHGQAISFEFIYKTDPDWLFVIDRDAAIGREGQSASQMLDNELIHKTKAWKNQQIIYLDGMNWYSIGGAGLTAMQQNIDQIAKALDKKS